MPIRINRRVSARVRPIAVILNKHVQLLVIRIGDDHLQRSFPSLARIHSKLNWLANRQRILLINTWTVRAHLRRIEMALLLNPGHKRRARYVVIVAQNVDSILADSCRPVCHIGRAVHVVDAIDLGLGGAFDREAERARLAVCLDDKIGWIANSATLQTRPIGLDERLLIRSDVNLVSE